MRNLIKRFATVIVIIAFACVLIKQTNISDEQFVRRIASRMRQVSIAYNDNNKHDNYTKYINIKHGTRYKYAPSVKIISRENRVLSYSLYGRDSWSKYGKHVASVAREAEKSKLYSNWSVRIYHDGQALNDKLRKEIKSKYKNIHLSDVRNISYLGNMSRINAMLWRYFPIGDIFVDIFCVRDLDSPLLAREEAAVTKWLLTNKVIHVMRDSIFHDVSVMGGLVCIRNNDRTLNRKMLYLILKYADKRSNTQESRKGQDQDLLGQHIWPLVKDNALHHDAYFCVKYKGSTPFPTKRDDRLTFVGCYRPCKPEGIFKPHICPIDCRPKLHKDWIYC